MAKIIKLTESDLNRIVRIIVEQSQNEPLVFSVVVDVPETNKDSLYNKIKEGLVDVYNNFSKVVQLDDKTNGVIILKGAMKFTPPSGLSNQCTAGWVNYTLKIQIKDNKFKVEMKDMVHEKSNPSAISSCELGAITNRENFTEKGLAKAAMNKIWNFVKTDTKSYFDGLSSTLANSVKTGKSDDFQP